MWYDRRSGARYPIAAKLEYAILRGSNVVEAGCGKVMNISSSGILFESEQALTPGMRVKLSIAWPVPLNEVALQLCISGSVVRTVANAVAVKVQSHVFRTRRASDLEKPAGPPATLRAIMS